jgi:PAS domain S-box-containing protein
LLPAGKFPRFALFAALLAALFLIYDIEFVRDAFDRLLLSNCLDAFAVALASVSCYFVAFRSSGYARQVWFLLAVATSIAACGMGLSAYYQSFVPGSNMAPEPSDIFFFVWTAPVFLILLPRSEEESSGLDTLRLLDFLQIAIVALTAYLYFFYFTVLWKSDQTALVRGILIVYIVRDLILATAFLLRSRASVPPWFRRLSLVLTFVFIGTVVSHTDYLLTLAASTSNASWGDLLWMLPYVLLIVIAVSWKPSDIADFPATGTRASNLFTSQFFPLVMPLLVIFMARAIASQHPLLAWLTLGASVLCSSVRLILTNRRQHRISANLLATEKALFSSQQILTVAFLNSPDGFTISGFPDGQYIEVNDGFTRLTGFTREDSIGKTPVEMQLWVDAPSRQQALSLLREKGFVRNFEMQFRKKSGEIRDGLLSGSMVQLDGRDHALITVRDITEMKAAQAAVRTSEERFRSLVDNLHVGIVSCDAQGRVIFANQAIVNLLASSKDQVIGKNVYDLGLTALREDATPIPDSERPVATVIRTRKPLLNQLIGYRRSDSPYVGWTVMDVVPEFSSSGELLGMLISLTDITEQRRATEAVRQNEERFRTFVENLHVGIVSCDAEARIQYANPAILNLFGFSLGEALGKTEVDLGFEVLRENGMVLPASEGLIPTLVSTKSPITNRVIGWRRLETSKTVWTLLDAVPQCDSTGQVTQILLSLTDLTDQRRATEALRESEERFRTLVNNLQAAVVLSRLDGTIEYANPATRRMFNIPPDVTAEGKTPVELGITTLADDGRVIPPDDRPVNIVLRTRTPVTDMSIGFRHPFSNDVVWVFGSSVPRFDAHGNFVGVISSFTNLTEQRRATDALRESEERFRTLVRDLHVGVILHNPDGSLQFANQAALNIFGTTLDAALRHNVVAFGFSPVDVNGVPVPPENLPAPIVMRTKSPLRDLVLGWRRPDSNDIIWTFGNAVPQIGPDGSLLRIISSFSDITEMKTAERSIHRLSTELLKLQDEERRRIGRELHDGMAQTVLAVNLSLAQIRQSGQTLSDTSKRALDKARDLLQQMSREIRTLSYLLHPPLLDDLGLVTALKEYANGFSERSGIDVSLELPPRFRRLPQMVETAFFRITQESLSNIQRHSGSQNAKVTLQDDTESVVLEITDYGRGMSLPGNGQPHRPPRLGVGIPGMRERMAQLGGYLDIESNSQGTTVRARILHSAPALKDALYESPTSSHRG